jgi:cyanophycin synthetase
MSHAWTNAIVLRSLKLAARLRSWRARRSCVSKAAQRIRSDFYGSVWRSAAEKIGASIRMLDDDVIQIERDEFVARVRQNDTPVDDYVTVRIANHKPLCYRLLAEAGLPVPRHARFEFPNLRPAIDFLKAYSGDCVVKPACDTGGGIGVTTRVRTDRQLARAAAAAAVYGDRLMIEEKIAGDTYRLLYLDGRLLDAVMRCAPTVVGDGRSTVSELVERVNAERIERGAVSCQSVLAIDLDAEQTLAAQGLRPSSRPRARRVVRLKSVVNDNSRDENVTVVDRLCSSLIDAGARAAEAIGVRLAGVDLITTDPTVPLAESRGVILEVNASPGHHWHYQKRDGKFAVAEHVLEALLRDRRSECITAALHSN